METGAAQVNQARLRDRDAGVCAAAVAVRNAAGEPVASLSVTVPTSRFTSEAVRERLVPALKRYGRAIEAQLARTGR